MRMWSYYVGVHLPMHDLLLLAFVALFAARVLRPGNPIALPPAPVQRILLWLWLAAGLSALTYFALDFSLEPASVRQFWKSLAALALYTAGLTAVTCYLCDQPAATSRRVLQVYLLGVALSCAYSFAEVGSAYVGFDLGKAIFGRISIYAPDFNWDAPFYYEWDVFFRAAGFTGVNAQGTYAVSAVPLLLLARPFRRPAVNLSLAALCLAGTALTFSRNAFVCLLVSLFLYALLRPQLAMRYLPRAAAICLPVLVLALTFSAGARAMVSTRLYKSLDEIGRGRFEVYSAIWQTIKTHPWGHGANQFSVVVLNTNQVDLTAIANEYSMWTDEQVRQSYTNPHNNWLNWLFEGGWPLLAAKLGYYLAILLACLRTRSPLGIAAFCTLGSLMLSGCFNMTLTLFSTELLFVLLPVTAILAAREAPAGAKPTPC
jgi:O-antigen ligase